eukprot:TRINITY_DN37461_c0_g1_i1.p1 TRINITY_DN37461_c0_g1~~TRINITY_DN37461_c0_g1_i1.p1  ORF type:complete len:143 (+),score=17.04 TRINITY_DN37461_c0_g1_i1:189-617(+)
MGCYYQATEIRNSASKKPVKDVRKEQLANERKKNNRSIQIDSVNRLNQTQCNIILNQTMQVSSRNSKKCHNENNQSFDYQSINSRTNSRNDNRTVLKNLLNYDSNNNTTTAQGSKKTAHAIPKQTNINNVNARNYERRAFVL